ncbi:MAG: 1-acyl-sn-glycerol-3-phosphate acyltransferase [Syntrophales bacterium]|jgi:1-acyl-sn-glycerol-3-phosphate acyltransferase|nr:1-acyl-sn-glycerol-3-phosphate acyltransferase [Syntrophales bacterium]MCK9391075.1 1-acyl-sn-glycerol-3-phosphate acyltransferase [Syntrophales bacterium]
MLSSLTRRIWDIAVTLILWFYYIMGYLVIFSPFYLYTFFFSPRREASFQKLNQILHRLFFSLVRVLIPGVKWRISDEVSSIRSSIIIANHLSFLDPILFVSLYEKQKTIVKSDYFQYPVFGWILKTSGYMPSMADGLFTEDMMNQVKNMAGYLAAGGNLFIFPEGTRSRDGRIGPFDKGAFSIAKLCRAPIRVVSIGGTNKLYPPDSLWFHTGSRQPIEVALVGSIEPDYKSCVFSLPRLMAEAYALMEGKEAVR